MAKINRLGDPTRSDARGRPAAAWPGAHLRHRQHHERHERFVLPGRAESGVRPEPERSLEETSRPAASIADSVDLPERAARGDYARGSRLPDIDGYQLIEFVGTNRANASAISAYTSGVPRAGGVDSGLPGSKVSVHESRSDELVQALTSDGIPIGALGTGMAFRLAVGCASRSCAPAGRRGTG